MPGVGGTNDTASIPGRFDHFAYDPATHRLFVAAVANGSLEVIDLDKGERIKSISGLGHPQGVTVAGTNNIVVVACGSEGAIRAYDTRTLAEKGKCEIGEDADNVRFANGYIFVGYGSETAGAIATVDPKTLTKISEMPLKAHPESFQIDPDGRHVYVNIPWASRADVDGSVIAGDLQSGQGAIRHGRSPKPRAIFRWHWTPHITRVFVVSHEASEVDVPETLKQARSSAKWPAQRTPTIFTGTQRQGSDYCHRWR